MRRKKEETMTDTKTIEPPTTSPSNDAACSAAKSITEIRRLIPAYHFEFLDLARCEVINRVPVGRGWVYVIGQTGDAAYEWIAHTQSQEIRFSSCGYGSLAAALRDGLVVGCGDEDVAATDEGITIQVAE